MKYFNCCSYSNKIKMFVHDSLDDVTISLFFSCRLIIIRFILVKTFIFFFINFMLLLEYFATGVSFFLTYVNITVFILHLIKCLNIQTHFCSSGFFHVNYVNLVPLSCVISWLETRELYNVIRNVDTSICLL